MGESINYRIARIIVEAYLDEAGRGLPHKWIGYYGGSIVYRRNKSGEHAGSPVTNDYSGKKIRARGKEEFVADPRNKLNRQDNINSQNAKGKGNKAKRRMKSVKEARGYAGRVDKKGGIARRFKSGERNRGTEGINQWQNASHTLPGSRGTSKTRGLGLIDRETRRARTRNDMKDNINMDNADTGVGRVKISSKNRKKLLGDKGK
jgi:hypothetical protein